jgi:hypothetical protein
MTDLNATIIFAGETFAPSRPTLNGPEDADKHGTVH